MGNYILRMVSAGLLCGIVQIFFRKSKGTNTVVRLMCGMLLTLTVLSPILNFRQWQWNLNVLETLPDSADIISDGETAAKDAMAQIISQKTTSYILDKANALGAELDVEIALSDDKIPIPYKATIRGSASPYIRKQLTQRIRDELGILEENQEWIF